MIAHIGAEAEHNHDRPFKKNGKLLQIFDRLHNVILLIGVGSLIDQIKLPQILFCSF